MKKFHPILFFPITTLLLTACPENSSGGNKLPKNPDKLVIRWSESGGMLPVSKSIYISNDSASWEYWRYKGETIISWEPTEKELDDLYQTFVKHNFDKLESYSEGEVYDRGGVSMDFTVDDQSFNASNSGMSFIKDKWKNDWSVINSAVKSYAQSKVNQQLINKDILIDESIKNAPFEVLLRVNENEIYGPNSDTVSGRLKQSFYPGQNQIEITQFYRDSVDKYNGKVSESTNMYFQIVSDSIQSFTFTFKEGKSQLHPSY